MDVGLAYLMTKSIVKVNNESTDKYSSTGTLSDAVKTTTSSTVGSPPRRGTIDALDLSSPTTKGNRHHRTPRTSLEHIATRNLPRGSLDGLDSVKLSLLPLLSKAKSDSNVNGNQGARQWLQAVNVGKTMAYIDNSFERAHVTNQHNVEQKRTNLLQRKASIQLKVDHMERQMKMKLKKSDSGNKTGPKRDSAGPSVAFESEIVQLRDELIKIEADLKAEAAKKDGNAKEMNLSRTKAIQVVQLLEAASGDLPENGPESPENASIPKIVVSGSSNPSSSSKSMDPLPTPKDNKDTSRPKQKSAGQSEQKQERHHGTSLANVYLRRSKSRLKSLATGAKDLRRNVKGFDVRRQPANRPDPHVGQSSSTTSRVRSASEGGASQLTFYAPADVSTMIPTTGSGTTTATAELSSGTSSEEENEPRTEISANTWNEIEAFELLIGNHMRSKRTRKNERLPEDIY